MWVINWIQIGAITNRENKRTWCQKDAAQQKKFTDLRTNDTFREITRDENDSNTKTKIRDY